MITKPLNFKLSPFAQKLSSKSQKLSFSEISKAKKRRKCKKKQALKVLFQKQLNKSGPKTQGVTEVLTPSPPRKRPPKGLI